jgi:TPR repeat protein
MAPACPRGDVSAYVWFKLAAAQGDKGAGVNLNMLARLMPADKVAEAERQAKE